MAPSLATAKWARAVARRSLCAIALTSLVNRKLPAHALGENAGNLQAPPEYFGTKTGLTYFDKKIFFGNGFEVVVRSRSNASIQERGEHFVLYDVVEIQ